MSIQYKDRLPEYKMQQVFAYGRNLSEASLHELFFEKFYWEVLLWQKMVPTMAEACGVLNSAISCLSESLGMSWFERSYSFYSDRAFRGINLPDRFL